MGRDGVRHGDNLQPHPGSKRSICEAMLVAVGEQGYQHTSIQDVVKRGGVSRSRFYQCFTDKEDCFVAAYETVAGELSWEIIAAGQSGEWIECLRQGLATLLDFVANKPAIALALIVEVRAAGSAAVAQQDRIVERLTRAIDSARRQSGSRHTAPQSTARLMIGAIEGPVRRLLVNGEADRAPALLGDLVYLVVQSYFGEDAAFAAMDESRQR